MEKLIYLLGPRRGQQRTDVIAPLLDEIAPGLGARGASQITVHVADLDAEMDTPETTTPRIFGEWQGLAGAVHLWLDCLDARGPIEAMLSQVSEIAGYLVTESVVQPYERSWQGRERRPGVTQFSLGHKAPGASEAHFYHHWQEVHSPFSFDLHPHRWSYVRNDVARTLTPGSTPWRFIVLEHWRDLREFTDEALYYGGPAIVEQCWQDVPEFLDMDSYVSGPMSEFHFD